MPERDPLTEFGEEQLGPEEEMDEGDVLLGEGQFRQQRDCITYSRCRACGELMAEDEARQGARCPNGCAAGWTQGPTEVFCIWHNINLGVPCGDPAKKRDVCCPACLEEGKDERYIRCKRHGIQPRAAQGEACPVCAQFGGHWEDEPPNYEFPDAPAPYERALAALDQGGGGGTGAPSVDVGPPPQGTGVDDRKDLLAAPGGAAPASDAGGGGAGAGPAPSRVRQPMPGPRREHPAKRAFDALKRREGE